MSLLPALNARQLPHPTPAAQGDARSGGRVAAAHEGHPNSPLNGVSLSQGGLDLSAQALLERTDALGNATLDVAQGFLNSFTRSLLGDAADGATIQFDSASLSVESSFAAAVRHREGPNGSFDAAAFRLSESAHFIGKGTITTADGQSYEFEIEVQYDARIDASTANRSRDDAGSAGSGAAPRPDKASADDALPTRDLPNVNFPGSLNDLFKLLGQQLRGDLQAPPAEGGAAQGGSLSLRMLNLVKQATQLDAGATQARDEDRARAKMLADAYGVPVVADAAATDKPAV
ncbi:MULTISPECIES: hypothetical protein [unclassified Janthinobacterium]|uniref:hypothetical protein n=1 Tax=unclassified Janthinobacterium TaxID=2610881 RepID=UPI0003471DC3|nr:MULTISPECIES: hypothetical protein [unclassified Janthinobacterium]MEC5162508.1 hypothetical protein [Janthinobacterium sp. CG_S6]